MMLTATSVLPRLPPPPSHASSAPGMNRGAMTSSAAARWSVSLLRGNATATPRPPFTRTAVDDALEAEDTEDSQHDDDIGDDDEDEEDDPEDPSPRHNAPLAVPHLPTSGVDEEDSGDDEDDTDDDDDDDDDLATVEGTGDHSIDTTRDSSEAASPALHPMDTTDAELSAFCPVSLNPYSPFFGPSSSPSSSPTCECHRASQSRLSSVPVASPSNSRAFPSPPSASPPSQCTRPSCSLLSALSSLRQSEKMSDVCFLVGGGLIDEAKEESKDAAVDCAGLGGVERISAHRTVLSSRSSVFDRMFDNGKTVESTHRRSLSGGPLSLACDVDDPLQISVPDITPTSFRLMLDFIYLDEVPGTQMTEKVAATALHYPSLLYASIKYDLPRLQGAVRTALHTVIPSIACQLWQSLLAMREDELADKYHLHIMQHAASLIKTDGFLALPYPLLLQLIKDDRLQVSELALFKALYRWMERRSPEPHPGLSSLMDCKDESRVDCVHRQFKQQLLPYVRFPLMTARELAVHIAPTRLLTDAELAALFIHISSNQQTPAPAAFNATPRVACPSLIPLTYHHDGDEHGLVWWLGTAGYTLPFTNPHLTHRCALTFSSIQFGQPSSLTSRRRDVQLWTHNRPSSWVELDIDPQANGLLLVPSHISLQHGYDRPLDCLTSWTLEGSCDRWEWDVLLEKRGVVAFREGYERRTWALPVTVVKGYRMFRIRGTGKDSSERTEYVCVGGVELYGELQVLQPAMQKKERRGEEEQKVQGGQGEKRQREEAAVDELQRDQRQPLGNEGLPLNAADDGRVSDVTAAVDEERRCWKAARQCCLM